MDHPRAVLRHSDLTTGVQLADLVAYVVSWNFRFGAADAPARNELDPPGQIIREMRYRALRDIDGNPEFGIWSITLIPDLRTRDERTEN